MPGLYGAGLYGAGVYPPTATPQPVYQVPVLPVNKVTYFTTSLFGGGTLAELPLTNVTWGYVVNGVGQFSGTLHVEDPRVTNLNWVQATDPNLTCLWVDINGTLVWGGIIQDQAYSDDKQTVDVKAVDFCGYLSQRLQAQDYATTWVTSSAGAAQIAHQVISDALAVANSAPLSVSTPAATPSAYRITLAAPISQRMTADMLVRQLQQLGFNIGFDFASDVQYVAGVPSATITLSYPRRGRIAGTTGLTLDVVPGVKFSYQKQGGQQANQIVEMASSSGGTTQTGTWAPSMTVDGYPLLEKSAFHVTFSPTASPATVLQAYIADDLSLYAYPAATAQVEIPLFADPPIGSWIVGDDVRVMIAPKPDGGVPVNPRFPNGLDFYLRIIKADVSVPEAGVPKVAFTLAMPPSSSPQRPPQ